MDIHHQLDRLRILKSLTHEDSARIYHALTSEIKTYDQINLVFPLTPSPLTIALVRDANGTRWPNIFSPWLISPIQESALRSL